jgi:hypothetical protein
MYFIRCMIFIAYLNQPTPWTCINNKESEFKWDPKTIRLFLGPGRSNDEYLNVWYDTSPKILNDDKRVETVLYIVTECRL